MSRFNHIVLAVAAVAGALVGPAALADPGRYRGWDRHADRADSVQSDSDYARVLDVQPITRRIRISEPRRECYQETRYEATRGESQYRARSEAPAAGSMILGGLLGAVIGNQVGRGDGRRAATVAGALIGSALGHDAASRSAYVDDRYAGARYEDSPRAYSVERCDVRYQDSWEERIEGYRVAYEYLGRRYETRMPYDPGKRVRVRVDVFPDP